MTPTKIKICGVTKPEHARTAAECGAWAVGLMFYPKSPRFVTAEQALELIAALPKEVLKIGVFMDTSPDVVKRVEEKVPLDLVQFHGRGAAATALAIGVDRAVLAAVLQQPSDVERFKKEPAAYLLVDRHRVGAEPSGTSVNWELARQLAEIRRGTLLAGALTPENVGQAICTARPFGVDVSGGVESTPGTKDVRLIRAFCDAVRKADEAAEKR